MTSFVFGVFVGVLVGVLATCLFTLRLLVKKIALMDGDGSLRNQWKIIRNVFEVNNV